MADEDDDNTWMYRLLWCRDLEGDSRESTEEHHPVDHLYLSESEHEGIALLPDCYVVENAGCGNNRPAPCHGGQLLKVPYAELKDTRLGVLVRRILDLEGALLDSCSATSILTICKGKPFPERLRHEAWAACLGVRDRGDQLANFNAIYDLPDQQVLRDHCSEIVEKLGNDDEDKLSVVSDVESILTYYCKSNNVAYNKSNGWIEVLLPILALKRPIAETYNLFESVLKQFIPKKSTNKNDIYHLFRLLILYHDPELCSFLDTKKTTPDLYAWQWFRSLFSGTCDLRVIHPMWDLYFQQSDPFFVFFLSLVIVLNGREHILSLKSESKSQIIDVISMMPASLEFNDVTDFCSLAQYYAVKTPTSFKKELYEALFGTDDEPRAHSASPSGSPSKQPLSQALCLPVSASELVENAAESDLDDLEDPLERVRFFLVDCRPADQYNAGHLSTAFHLDCNLMLQEPAAFNVAVQGLLAAQKQSIAANSNAGGEHLCFLGSGRDEEDQYTHMVVASFLQKHILFVSMLAGGYQAIHDYFGSDMSDCLEEHDATHCLVCRSQEPRGELRRQGLGEGAASPLRPGEDYDLLGKISAVVKEKSADLKERLIEYIVNPSGSDQDRHISARDKVGKLYRNTAPVFSIDDENLPDAYCANEGEDVDDEEPQVVSLAKYLKSEDTVAHFKCQEVKENGFMYDSYLLVTKTHILVLREATNRKGQAALVLKRSLSTIAKITSKKKHPDLITFKYGSTRDEAITDMDRFFIPKASEATKLISKQIMEYVRTTEDV